ncbi:MAG: RluA family pseudouridine synthase [Poseidonibacter sp.]|uniref:RluA family pseudouridine synthase n=1 Tax=Poseidonibacter sp. TaxID=2321188 RepID=UPI00359E7E3C
MPYVLKEFKTIKGKKIEHFLEEDVKINKTLALKLLAKGKITDQINKRLQKSQTLKDGFIKITLFEAITKNLKPLFQTEHFAIFDKPSGLMVHPTLLSKDYTLLDEIRYQFGENASLVHRIDKETSGLIMVSKNKYSEMILKNMFEEKQYIKKYIAIVRNEIKKEIEISTPITNDTGLIKLKMKVDVNGKDSQTLVKPLFYDKEKNQTLVEVIPLTGRQHQIRVHLDSINHSIIGDPIYGVDEKIADLILKKEINEKDRIKLTGNKRLLLQANYLEFEYLNVVYKFCSKQQL